MNIKTIKAAIKFYNANNRVKVTHYYREPNSNFISLYAVMWKVIVYHQTFQIKHGDSFTPLNDHLNCGCFGYKQIFDTFINRCVKVSPIVIPVSPINPIYTAKVKRAVKWEQLYNFHLDLNEGNEDKMCFHCWEKYQEVLCELPKREQKNITVALKRDRGY